MMWCLCYFSLLWMKPYTLKIYGAIWAACRLQLPANDIKTCSTTLECVTLTVNFYFYVLFTYTYHFASSHHYNEHDARSVRSIQVVDCLHRHFTQPQFFYLHHENSTDQIDDNFSILCVNWVTFMFWFYVLRTSRKWAATKSVYVNQTSELAYTPLSCRTFCIDAINAHEQSTYN